METCKEEEGRALALPFTYTITGCINGEQVEVVLEGEVSPGEVRFQTKLVSPKQPLLWDEAIVSLVALDPLLRLATALDFDLDAEELAADELAAAVADEFRVESSLYRECDLPVGRFVLVGVCSLAEGRVAARGQLGACRA